MLLVMDIVRIWVPAWVQQLNRGLTTSARPAVSWSATPEPWNGYATKSAASWAT